MYLFCCEDFVFISHLRSQAPPEPAEVAGMSQETVHAPRYELVRVFSLPVVVSESSPDRRIGRHRMHGEKQADKERIIPEKVNMVHK